MERGVLSSLGNPLGEEGKKEREREGETVDARSVFIFRVKGKERRKKRNRRGEKKTSSMSRTA